jgi:hypothetical protein
MKSKNRLGKLFVGASLALGIAGMGCLARPVAKGAPTTKVNFTNTVSQQAVDKVDLLFAIDNSESMGDKQSILKDAVPNLIQGLLTPPCVDKTTRVPTGEVANPNGNKDNNYGCGDNTQFEPDFKPVTDMHIGIVSSSLGNFGGDVCPSDKPRTNDRALLLRYKPDGSQDTVNAPDNFLAWFPQNDENSDTKRHPAPTKAIDQLGIDKNGNIGASGSGLIPDFQDLVVGVDQTGCGLEAQLESVYHFLIQPDPFDTIKLDNFKQADLGQGVDTDVLKMRADFLRPDSLVAIIMLSDEDDSSPDPLSVGGFGYAFDARDFPGSNVRRGTTAQGTTAPRGTTACSKDPGSVDCTSCGFAANCDPNTQACQNIRQDANCKTSGDPTKSGQGYDGFYGAQDDDLNVRYMRMKERYGVDPQYPISRYVNGFTKLRVPDRTGEHTVKTGANGQRQISDYVGAANCTNPLFADGLPKNPGDELCNLTRSTRSPDLVFFAMVGGVPNKLLHFDPSGTAQASDNNRITSDDWVKILGTDPLVYNYDGIDPHMVQSITARQNLLSGGDPESPRGQNGTDPVQGRDWDTQKKDLQYACTFDLPKSRACTAGATSCDCTNDPISGNPVNNTPLCATDGSATQIKAKAYPTIRQFEVVHALGDQGVIASLCPIQLTNPAGPDYGYKPAVAAIIDRLKNALTTQCLPQKLRTADEEAAKAPLDVPCLVLVQLSKESGQTCAGLGLAVPEPAILEVFKQQQRAESGNVGDGGLDLSTLETCQLAQTDVAKGETCANDTNLNWCYVENDTVNKKNPAGRCPQALIFASGTQKLVGARFSLQCIQQFSAGAAAGQPEQQ